MLRAKGNYKKNTETKSYYKDKMVRKKIATKTTKALNAGE